MEAKFRQGLGLHRQGRLTDAERIYQEVLRQQPTHFEALHLLGVIALQTRRIEQGIELIGKAITLKPDYAEAHNNRGWALADMGRPEEALSSYDRAIALRPDFAAAHYNRGNVLRDLGRPEQALSSYDKAIALKPDYAAAFSNRGDALAALGRPEEALSSYDRAIVLKPDCAEAYNNRGGALAALGRPREALSSFDRAIALKPDYAVAYSNRGGALAALGRPEEALSSYDRAIALKPDDAEAFNYHGGALADLWRPEEALSSYDRAIVLKPDYAEAYNNRGGVLADLGRPEEALSSFDRAIALKPDYAEAYSNRGGALADLGRPEEALSNYDRAIALKPDYAAAYSNRVGALADLGRPEEALSSFDRAIALKPDDATSSSNRGSILRDLKPQIIARFNLAKLWFEQNEHAAAFAQWTAGHELLRRIEPFSREKHLAFIEASIAILDRARLTEGARGSNTDPAPVFIVGMPRSGTTLCEQILAAHAQVHGAGERMALGRAFAALGGRHDRATAVARIAALDASQLDAAAEHYLAELHALAPNKARIVDKMPNNYQYLGLIGLMLPGAQIIHCVRDPRDIGLSIFTFYFSGNHGYAHDLADLGWTIAQEARLMAHWQVALPNPVVTVRLDDWVNDFDGTLARVLIHLDLPPDPNCARFYEAEHQVRTVSREQVRQPVNASGLGRWRHYAQELAPLITELERAGALQAWADPSRLPPG